ncbi:MAG: hypothetical protein OXE52_09575 [Chloroflexi bacterium]|nr:hypothetical protein [Chloroflexota bacterium]
MIAQPTPQEYLDDMHAIGIPHLFQSFIGTRERAAGIRRARQELGRLRTELTQHRDNLGGSNGALSPEETRRMASPLNLLLLLHEQLLSEVNDLEHSLSNGKPLPYNFRFGQHIFGDEDAGLWYIGSQEQFEEWGRIQQFKRRLDALRVQGQPIREQLGSIRADLQALGEKHHNTRQKIDRRNTRIFVMRRLGMLVVLMAASGTVGIHYFNSFRNFSLVAFGLAAACLILIPIVVANWKDPRTRLNSRRRKLESEMRDLQYEGNQYHQRYQPLELQVKALEVHYNRMMDSWENARLVKQRLDGFIEEAQPLREHVNEIRSELEGLRQQRDKLQHKLDGRQKRGAFFRRMFLHVMLVIASGALGFYLHYTNQRDYASVMYGLGAFFILLVPLAYIDWKNRDIKLESRLRQVETRMRQLQTEGKQVMKRYHPLELQIKTLIAQYKRLRAGIENLPESEAFA